MPEKCGFSRKAVLLAAARMRSGSQLKESDGDFLSVEKTTEEITRAFRNASISLRKSEPFCKDA